MTTETVKRRYQVLLGAETGKKIDELAERMNVSQAKMIEMLIDTAIEDNEWIIKAVTSRWSRALMDVLGVKKRKPREAIQ